MSTLRCTTPVCPPPDAQVTTAIAFRSRLLPGSVGTMTVDTVQLVLKVIGTRGGVWAGHGLFVLLVYKLPLCPYFYRLRLEAPQAARR